MLGLCKPGTIPVEKERTKMHINLNGKIFFGALAALGVVTVTNAIKGKREEQEEQEPEQNFAFAETEIQEVDDPPSIKFAPAMPEHPMYQGRDEEE